MTAENNAPKAGITSMHASLGRACPPLAINRRWVSWVTVLSSMPGVGAKDSPLTTRQRKGTRRLSHRVCISARDRVMGADPVAFMPLVRRAAYGFHGHAAITREFCPKERFIFDQGKGSQVIWATPAASYENLAVEIEKGSGDPWDAEVRSILEQLYKLFGRNV